jgi:uncharacterized protein (DUF2267 family)
MTRNEQIALYVEAFRASHKVDFQRNRAVLACMTDRFVRMEDFEGVLSRLQAKAEAAWAKAKAATTDHEIILDAAKVGA